MPAPDSCEPQVIRALRKAEWVVVDKPYYMRAGTERNIYADLRLRHLQDGEQLIVVEVKCFSGTRPALDEFYHALGQYLYYRTVLMMMGVTTHIYLTIPEHVYPRLVSRASVETTIQTFDVKLIVWNVNTEEIVQWRH